MTKPRQQYSISINLNPSTPIEIAAAHSNRYMNNHKNTTIQKINGTEKRAQNNVNH
jgi:hypothetical protein